MPRRAPSLLLVAAALLLAACAPTGMRLPQSDLLSVLERKAGRIAYLGLDGNIYTLDQGGGQPAQLTADAVMEGERYHVYGVPVWSADSQRLAFAAYSGVSGQDPDTNQLFVAGPDGAGLKSAYASPDYLIYYGWAPDGQQVGLLSATRGTALALKRVAAEGGEPQTLDTGNPFYWTWAPDSQSVLIHANGEAGRLAFLNLGAAVTERGLGVEPTAFKAPAFSPDGQRVLFSGRTASGAAALFVADADGGAARALVEHPANDVAFVWSPDGRRVAYIASTQLAGPLTVMDAADGGHPVTAPDEAYGFFWSPDSAALAYFAVETQPAATPESGAGGEAQEQYIWKLMIMDARTGAVRELARFQPVERFLQLLPFFDQYHQALTIWSPDSQNLVVAAYAADGRPAIFVVAASGNLEPRYLADGLVGVWSWR